jgi:hypothetical protein
MVVGDGVWYEATIQRVPRLEGYPNLQECAGTPLPPIQQQRQSVLCMVYFLDRENGCFQHCIWPLSL